MSPPRPEPAPECIPTVRTERILPPADLLVDVAEPVPENETIGAKLVNRLDLRAGFRELRSRLESLRQWAAGQHKE